MYTVQIPIGDWSHDGHSKCDWFVLSSNKPPEAIYAAWHAAVEQYPEVNPDKICEMYDDNTVSVDQLRLLDQYGFRFENHSLDEELRIYDADIYLDLVLWFIKKGDPELELDRVSIHKIISWNDPKGARDGIPMLGYGIMSYS